MKNFLNMLMGLLLVLGLASCGGSSDGSSGTQGDTWDEMNWDEGKWG